MSSNTLQRQSRVTWFEIPVTDFERAVAFYEKIFAVTLKQGDFGPDRLGMFPYDPPAIGGCIIKGDRYRPGPDGVAIYLNADPVLAEVLARVEQAGGKVVLPRTALPEGMGYYAHIIDSEGNRVGLHAVA
jgi:predicted enzyme related to lactoylglutathione lyase